MNAFRRLLGHPSNSGVLTSLIESITTTGALHAVPSLRGVELAAAQQLTKLSLFSSNSAATASASSLYVACIFERLPLVMPHPPQWELDYAKWQETLMARQLKPVPKDFTDDKRVLDEQASGGPSAESRWQPAPLETAADRSGDRKTTRRRLDQRIFMLIKKANGHWEFPHVHLEAGENTRTGAERALREVLGNDGFQPYFVGNAPAGHVALTNGTFFFHRCQLIQGVPALVPGGQWGDVAWAAKDELGEYIKDQNTLELLQKML